MQRLVRAPRGVMQVAPFLEPNPLQRIDLREILRRTPNKRRGAVACAFLGITQKTLADAAGVTPRLFSYYFPAAEHPGAPTGAVPKVTMLHSVAGVLGLDPQDLWEI